MSEADRSSIFKANFTKAHEQLTKGCGRQTCLNPNCAAYFDFNTIDSNQAAVKVISISQQAPDQNLELSSEFIFCADYKSQFSIQQLISLDPSEIKKSVNDLNIFGQNFISQKHITADNPAINWEELNSFFGFLSELMNDGILLDD